MAKSKTVKKQVLNYDLYARIIARETGLCLHGEFKIPPRQLRWDYAIPEIKTLIEVQGGTWNRGAHGRGSGIQRDMEKLNYSACRGWRCLQYTPQTFCAVVKVVEDLKKCRATL